MLRSLRAVGVHPIHAVLVNKAGKRLRELFARFVECLGRAVAVRTEAVVLSFHHAAESAHEDAALADEVGRHFVVEGGREEVAGTDGDADGERILLSLAGSVLRDGIGGVDAGTIEEVATHVRARTLRSDHDHVHILGRIDACDLAVLVSETMREVKRLARGHVLLDLLPHLANGPVRREKHHDVTLFSSLFNGEERLARHPAILERTAPAGVRALALALTDDHIDAVVPHVERLCRPLNAVAEHGDCLALENLLGLLERKLLARHNVFGNAAKVDLHFSLTPLFFEKRCVVYHFSAPTANRTCVWTDSLLAFLTFEGWSSPNVHRQKAFCRVIPADATRQLRSAAP